MLLFERINCRQASIHGIEPGRVGAQRCVGVDKRLCYVGQLNARAVETCHKILAVGKHRGHATQFGNGIGHVSHRVGLSRQMPDGFRQMRLYIRHIGKHLALLLEQGLLAGFQFQLAQLVELICDKLGVGAVFLHSVASRHICHGRMTVGKIFR